MAQEIKAPITGTIWKITCTAQGQVAEGDTVIIMESMKMEMPVETECSGKVATVHVKEGQPVQEGQLLVTIED